MTQNGPGLLRPRFFDRQQLRAADLMAGQEYLRERLRRHNRFLHGFGVVCGAEVTAAGREENPWLVSIGEGYLVTPGGDEVYLPALPEYDIRKGAEACLGTLLPCPDPSEGGETIREGELRIIRARINPPERDMGNEYNREWVDLMLLVDLDLSGYAVEHTTGPGTPDEATNRYYLFQDGETAAAGSMIRIHSGAAEDDPTPAPDLLHRYVTEPGAEGSWRLIRQGDTIRVLDAEGEVVDTQSFQPDSDFSSSTKTVYLAACSGEEETCPQPAVAAACQPPGGVYEFSRVCEKYDLQIRCELPASHQNWLSCSDMEAIVCGGQNPPFPGALADEDNCTVLATIHILEDDLTIFIDDLTDRQLLLSESLLLNYLQCQCGGPEQPVAAFLARPDSGKAPLNVQFTDQSRGIISGWKWDFGDGDSSNQPSPTHVYEEAGIYTATLTVSGPGGSDTATGTVSVQPAVIAAFQAQPDSGRAPLTVFFIDQSTGNIKSWSWDFGDGNASSEKDPVHTYQIPGDYTVTLFVNGPDGSSMSLGFIRITGLTPSSIKASFGAQPASGRAPLNVSFTDFSSGNITSRNWNFGDGGTSSQRNPNHTYLAAGSYLVRLVVSGPDGSDFAVSTIIVSGPPTDITSPTESITLPSDFITFPTESITLPSDFVTFPTESITLPSDFVTFPTDSITSPSTFTMPGGFSLPSQFSLPIDSSLGPVGPPIIMDPRGLDLDLGMEVPVERISGIGEVRGGLLRDAGITNVLQFSVIRSDQLAELIGVSEVQAADFQTQARELMRRADE